MVAKIDRPLDDAIDVITRSFDERGKHLKFYRSIKSDYIIQNQLYEVAEGCPSIIKPLNLLNYTSNAAEADLRKTSLINLYTPKPDKLPYEEIERIRKDNELVSCPMCGEPGRPRTLDHFLPKAVYPELSINLLNLVPCCDWCQGEKKVEYTNNIGQRCYIHPYFDEVNFPLFKLVFSPPYLTPVIDIEVYSHIEVALKSLIMTHLDGVGFLDRFSSVFKTSYRPVLRMASKSRVQGNISVARSLNAALEIAEDKGVNSWDAILYRSVLEDANLMSFLETANLPSFL